MRFAISECTHCLKLPISKKPDKSRNQLGDKLGQAYVLSGMGGMDTGIASKSCGRGTLANGQLETSEFGACEAKLELPVRRNKNYTLIQIHIRVDLVANTNSMSSNNSVCESGIFRPCIT